MTIVQDFQNGVDEALEFGQQLRFKYFNVINVGEYYDDDIKLVQSGTDLWTSGVILPINGERGSNDAVLLEQGKILTNDTKLYIAGTINTSGTLRVGLGSPIDGEYSLLSQGVTKWNVNQTAILKKLYVRKLLTGSLTGEYN